MTSITLPYRFSDLNKVLAHSYAKSAFLRDHAADYSEGQLLKVDAEARSGDYFVTLAMKLDNICLEADDYRTKALLEEIVSDLIYLQDNYVVIKNK